MKKKQQDYTESRSVIRRSPALQTDLHRIKVRNPQKYGMHCQDFGQKYNTGMPEGAGGRIVNRLRYAKFTCRPELHRNQEPVAHQGKRVQGEAGNAKYPVCTREGTVRPFPS